MAIWVKDRSAKPERAAPVSALTTEAPRPETTAPMAAPTGGMGLHPEGSGGGDERQRCEADVGTGREELRAADDREARTLRGVVDGEVADVGKRHRDLGQKVADDGDGVGKAAGRRAPAVRRGASCSGCRGQRSDRPR